MDIYYKLLYLYTCIQGKLETGIVPIQLQRPENQKSWQCLFWVQSES